jgi:hypothetical protein
MKAVAATAAPPVEQLAVRARVGERQAFVSLCAPHREAVFDSCSRRCEIRVWPPRRPKSSVRWPSCPPQRLCKELIKSG